MLYRFGRRLVEVTNKRSGMQGNFAMGGCMIQRGRRQWLKTIAAAGLGAVGSQFVRGAQAQARTVAAPPQSRPLQPLALRDYQPKSMLHVPETHVPRSRFPNIDFHSHLSWV